MTEVPVLVPPVLYLPSHHLAQAEDCVADARRALARSADAGWVSAVADAYRRELHDLDAIVGRLDAAIEHARDRLANARMAARAHGQL